MLGQITTVPRYVLAFDPELKPRRTGKIEKQQRQEEDVRMQLIMRLCFLKAALAVQQQQAGRQAGGGA